MEKANYRDGLDALNALVDEQRKTNILLEKLLEKGDEHERDNKLEVATPRKRGNRRISNNAK